MKISTRTLTGTAVLGALVVVFDYTMKFSGLKIPFIPPLQFLHFDFTGIPIVLSLLLFDLMPGGITTSAVAFFAILVRSGNPVGPLTKALAEFSTIFGVALGLKWFKSLTKFTKSMSCVLGIVLRCVIMFFANLAIQPVYYGTPFMAVLLLSPLVGLFNAIQGSISILGGYLIYEAFLRRTPSYSEISAS
jgi:riboflavin transporter FmnP